jgi:hypothetical protein
MLTESRKKQEREGPFQANARGEEMANFQLESSLHIHF